MASCTISCWASVAAPREARSGRYSLRNTAFQVCSCGTYCTCTPHDAMTVTLIDGHKCIAVNADASGLPASRPHSYCSGIHVAMLTHLSEGLRQIHQVNVERVSRLIGDRH